MLRKIRPRLIPAAAVHCRSKTEEKYTTTAARPPLWAAVVISPFDKAPLILPEVLPAGEISVRQEF